LFVFVDGLGIGSKDPEINPLARFMFPHLTRLAGGRPPVNGDWPRETAEGVARAVDACLGVPGEPQSATGQVALLSGVNAPALMRRHISAHPPPPLRRVLAETGLCVRLTGSRRRVTFLNAFRPESLRRMAMGTYRATATTVAFIAAGAPLRTFADLETGRALSHDITGETLAAAGHPVPIVSPAEAASRAVAVAAAYDLTLFEYFLTDTAGHRQGRGEVEECLSRLDAFIGGLLAAAVPAGVDLLLVSDHGNIEDLRLRGHTRNPVPALYHGRHARRFSAGVVSLVDITPAICRVLGGSADGRTSLNGGVNQTGEA